MANDKNNKSGTNKSTEYNKIDLRKGLNDITFSNRQAIQIINGGGKDDRYGQRDKQKSKSPKIAGLRSLKGLKGNLGGQFS